MSGEKEGKLDLQEMSVRLVSKKKKKKVVAKVRVRHITARQTRACSSVVRYFCSSRLLISPTNAHKYNCR